MSSGGWAQEASEGFLGFPPGVWPAWLAQAPKLSLTATVGASVVPHCDAEEKEAQRGSVTGPGSHSRKGTF